MSSARSSLCLTYIYNMLRCVSIYRSAPPPPTTMSVFTIYRIITHSLCAKADLKVSSAPQLPPGIYRSWQQLTVEILRRAAANIVDNQGLPHSRSCRPSQHNCPVGLCEGLLRFLSLLTLLVVVQTAKVYPVKLCLYQCNIWGER